MASVTCLFAIVEEIRKQDGKSVREPVIKRISMDGPVLAKTGKMFEQMADTFASDNPSVIDFEGRYTPSHGEVFRIEGFSLPTALQKAMTDPMGCPELSIDVAVLPKIKAILAGWEKPTRKIVFQAFDSGQIVYQSRSFFQLHGKNTFSEMKHPGITIGEKLDAVFQKGELHFRSYFTTNRFLDLSDYFREASDNEVRGVLTDGLLEAEDEAKLLGILNATMRRRFTTISQTKILEQVTAEEVQAAAEALDMSVEVAGEKVVMPSDKKQAKDLLDLLCQARFKGALTGEVLVANSFRAEKSKQPPTDGKKATKPGKKSPKK